MSRLVSSFNLLSALLTANIITFIKHVMGFIRKLNPIYNSPGTKVRINNEESCQ